jgi:hypothetical protein
MNFLLFILMAYGLTQILVYSDMPILKKLRPSKESYRGYGKVFHCPMCMGFHVGWFLVLLSPWTELFMFDPTLVNAFLFGCLSSGGHFFRRRMMNNYLIGKWGLQPVRRCCKGS